MSVRRLHLGSTLSLPQATERFLGRISLNLAPHDAMYDSGRNDAHYLYVGASALNVIMAILQLADIPHPATILDFGAGAGRVTRWLRAAFPTAALSACDIRTEDLNFCRQEFSAETWISGTNIDALSAPDKYDLIWSGSVLTHLSADDSIKLINKLLGWTQPSGILAISLHGRFAKWRQDVGEFRYIHDEAWEEIGTQLSLQGFGYADYASQSGYGISLAKLTWSAALIENLPGVRLIALAEQAWDGHHDVLVIQNRAVTNDPYLEANWRGYETTFEMQKKLAQELEKRQQQIVDLQSQLAACWAQVSSKDRLIDQMQASASWRVTAPLRAVKAHLGRLRR